MLDLNKKIKIEFEVQASDVVFLPIAIKSFVENGGSLNQDMVVSKDVLERLSVLAQEILNQFTSKLSEVRINDKVENTVSINAELNYVWEIVCLVLREKLNYLSDTPQPDTDSFNQGDIFTFDNGEVIVDKIISLQEIRLKHSLSDNGEAFEIYLLNETESGTELTLCLESSKDYLYELLTDYMDTLNIVKEFAEKDN